MSEPLLQKTIESIDVGELQEEVAAETAKVTPNSNLLRNIVVGVAALAGTYLYLKPAKAEERKKWSTDMNLTRNIKLGEYLVSSSIPELKEYELSTNEMNNVIRHANLLQEIRDQFQTPVFISSGGRPAALTARSGKYKGLNFVQILSEKGYKPALFSQHMDFSAADFTVQDRSKLKAIYEYLLNKQKIVTGLITQVILYIENGAPDFIHLGVHSEANNFERIVGDEKFLLAKVTVSVDSDGSTKRTTSFERYEPEKLQQMIA